MPLENPIGFGPLDFLELAAALLLILAVLLRLRLPVRKPWLWAIALALLPVALRLALLYRLPVPVPHIYDEFGHLLEADTLRHFRFANPPHSMHRFFETIFVLQEPTYSAIYPIGSALVLALFPHPWFGVLIACGAFCSLAFWMLRGWLPGAQEWALAGGFLCVMEFGPLNVWANSYWGGYTAAIAGCLVFGALPRLRVRYSARNDIVLGLGAALHLLTRPFESVFLLTAAVAYGVCFRFPRIPRYAPALLGAALAITAVQNRCVTGQWTRLPYQLSQFQYGVPAALTLQTPPGPHLPLTREQELEYRVQREFQHGPESFASYALRLLFRIRYYRFYFLPPLYIALLALPFRNRGRETIWAAATCLLFALGTNLFPAFQYHYLAGIVPLFLLLAISGLRALPPDAARVLFGLSAAQFALSFAFAAADPSEEPRAAVQRQLAAAQGRVLVFVRYWPNHIFQDEWVYNGAEIDAQRVVMARDLGDAEDLKLAAYYPGRTTLLLEPDARPPRLSQWQSAPAPPEEAAPAPASPNKPPASKPLLELEQVR